MLRPLFVGFITLFSGLALAQAPKLAKRPLNHTDYDRWQSVRLEQLSDNGRWISYQIDPQEGDGLLMVTGVGSPSTKYSVPRGYAARFSADSRFLVARIKAPIADTRKAKLKKKKADEMPKDSLVVLNLGTGATQKFPNVKSFALGKDGGSWVAFLQERKDDKAPARPAASRDTTAKAPANATASRKPAPKKPKGDDLVLLNMADGARQTTRYVSNMTMSENGQAVVYTRESIIDSLQSGDALVPGVFAFRTDTKQIRVIDTTRLHKVYKGLSVDKTGGQVAWMASADSAGADQKSFRLYYQNLVGAVANTPASKKGRPKTAATASTGRVLIADTTTGALPKGWSVNEFAPVRFSEDGQRLYFATSPVPPLIRKDTLTPDDEKVKMDVWTWTDARLQPMQQKRLKEEKERGYTTVYNPATGKVVLLASREVPTVSVNYKKDNRYLLGMSDMPYQVISSWDPGHTDLYLIDSQSGQKTKIANDIMASDMRISPEGKYAYWFDERDTLWRAWSITEGKRIDLTRGLPAKLFDEEHDTPNLPGSYGAAGWTTNDAYFWVYDRYDIWQIDPTGREKPRNLTNGWGRANKVRLRRIELDNDDRPAERPGIQPAADLYLTGFWESDKHTGILRIRPSKQPASPGATSTGAPEILLSSPHRYFGINKAKNAPTMTFYRGNFQEPINLFVTDTTFANQQQLSRVNAQQDSIRWGSVELVKWTGTNGTALEGLLYKPEDFDPNKKYPMLTYFYERSAETLPDYKFPAPSRSTINIPYCVSNGYLVFVPDIVYTTGNPGQNAYDCIVPGVLSLINRGFVDRDRLGIQGQSWGGYQTAYIITQTNLFKAAMAGAIVANMTSAYGGIRWGTGLVRQFQYEKTQSRIGGTLWEKPMHYIENSPLFYADRVQTPLMLMHNDADGSVPWYQGIEMFTALRRLQKPVWMVVYNGEDHNLVQRHNAKDLSIRMYQFFDHYLKDAPMPIWMKEGRSAVEKDRGEMKY
ncbi:S9 family peptidase [Rudanella lutea]|uniref:S9 family peptidase n=1 Tax=Rudanella lutea TaxID=451374 RepID=UPI0005C52BB0|nr:prolyl oligopeptidase family serine peptidase [Rudanella lutea]